MTSRQLVTVFGSLRGVFSASPDAIAQAAGPHIASLLTSAREAILEGLREDVVRTKCDAECDAFRQYLRARFSRFSEEVLIAVFLDGESRFICDEQIASGGMTALQISGRSLFRRAMELNAAALILAHNHPCGDARPSKTDVNTTRQLATVAQAMDIRLLDHLVIGRQQITSMRLAGLL